MDDNKTRILQEFEILKGQFVITAGWKIERLIAIGEDRYDYYWITYDGRKLSWNTCVGRLMPLKGYLRDKDYDELIRMARLNHFDQSTLWNNKNPKEVLELNTKHKNELMKIGAHENFLTELYWKLI
jgi:hypothetical protein